MEFSRYYVMRYLIIICCYIIIAITQSNILKLMPMHCSGLGPYIHVMQPIVCMSVLISCMQLYIWISCSTLFVYKVKIPLQSLNWTLMMSYLPHSACACSHLYFYTIVAMIVKYSILGNMKGHKILNASSSSPSASVSTYCFCLHFCPF